MSIRSEAEENLRIIRSLMEKATVYRAISAPGALVGGLLSTALAAWGGFGSAPSDCNRFYCWWLGVLAFTAVFNFWLLRREALRRGGPFISAGMRLALRAMLPGLLGGGLMILAGDGACATTAALWVLFYGISLLAASHFAPKSICWLGRAFFSAGVALLIVPQFGWSIEAEGPAANLIMGATFGLFHLIYAACTWPRRASARTEA